MNAHRLGVFVFVLQSAKQFHRMFRKSLCQFRRSRRNPCLVRNAGSRLRRFRCIPYRLVRRYKCSRGTRLFL